MMNKMKSLRKAILHLNPRKATGVASAPKSEDRAAEAEEGIRQRLR
jgi:hypothetical protein